MTPSELRDWLGSDESAGAGWTKDDGSGETIGHERYGSMIIQTNHDWPILESGRKIINILEKNPKKDPESYDEVNSEYSHS